jgi:hypothetical protein
MKSKQCNNECGSSWCCSYEFFTDERLRFDNDGLAVLSLRGIRLYENPHDSNELILQVPVVCTKLTPKGCSLREDRPMLCKEFPTRGHEGWVITDKCVYYEKGKFMPIEELTEIKIGDL